MAASTSSIAQSAWTSRGQIKATYDDLKNTGQNISDAVGYIEGIANGENGWLCERISNTLLAALLAETGPVGEKIGDLINDQTQFTKRICDVLDNFQKRNPGKFEDFFPGPNLLTPPGLPHSNIIMV